MTAAFARANAARAAIAGALVVLVVLGATAAPAAARTSAAPARPAVRRLLVISMPMVRWADVPLSTTPNLSRLLDQSLVADLSVRGVDRRPTIGDAYTTISAGARAVGSASDGNAAPRADGVVAPGFPAIVAHNHALLYDAEPGALGAALARAGIGRAAIGNADEQLEAPKEAFRRPVGLALASPNGTTPGGSVSAALNRRDASAPFGIAIDPAVYLQAFRSAWHDRAVVMVEDSDLLRYDDYRAQVGSNARAPMLTHLLGTFDALVGRMLASVDPRRDAVLVVGPAQSGGELTLAALRAPGVRPGLAESAYTRRAGFVSIVDVAPTILDVLHVAVPDSMEGRPFTLGRRGGDLHSRRAYLIDADSAAVFRDTVLNGVTTTLTIILVTVLLAIVVAARLRPGARRGAEVLGLLLLGGLPATFLAGLLPFYRWSQFWYFAFLAAVAGAVALAGIGIGVGAARHDETRPRRVVDPILLGLGVVVAVLVVDVVTGAHLELNTVFGYSPTVAGRFAGMGNIAFAQLSAAALLASGLLAYRVGGRRGAWSAVALLAIVILADGMPIWGSDVGGVLSMVPAYAIAASGFLGRRLRLRSIALALGAAVVAIAAFALVDLSRPSEHQTHLGRLIRSTQSNGLHVFWTTVLRKLHANFDVLALSRWGLIVPFVLLALYLAVRRASDRFERIYARIPPLRFAMVALVVLAALAFALNDSGITIPAIMLAVAAPVVLSIVVRTESVGVEGRRLPT